MNTFMRVKDEFLSEPNHHHFSFLYLRDAQVIHISNEDSHINIWCNIGYKKHLYIISEPRHEKICLCHMRITKAQISLDRCLDSIISLLAIAEISRP